MRDRFPLLVIGGLILCGVLASSFFRGASRGAFADKLSTYRSSEDGARALYLLAEQSGLDVRRLQRDLEIIDDRLNLVLLAVELEPERREDEEDKEEEEAKPPPFFLGPDAGVDEEDEEERLHTGWNRFRAQKVTSDERKKLLEHLEKGATLVYAPWHHRQNPLLDALEVRLHRADRELAMRKLVPAQPTPWTVGVERVEAHVRNYLELPDDAVPLLVDDHSAEAVAAVVPYGQGQVIVIGAPELAMNRALARADNAQFWLSLLSAVSATGPVAFDEFHHGFTSDRSISEFAKRYGLHWAAAQLLLGLVLWAGALRRFGRPRPPPEDVRVGSTDALFAASRLYREGRHFQYAASLIARGLSQDFASSAGLPARSEPGEVARSLASRGRKDLSAALLEVLEASNAVDSESTLTELARKAASARSLKKARSAPAGPRAATNPSAMRRAS